MKNFFRAAATVGTVAVLMTAGTVFASAPALQHHLARSYTYNVTDIYPTMVTLHGMVSAEYSGPGEMWFEYGTQNVFNNYAATWPSKSTVQHFQNSGYNDFTTTIYGLKPNTTYHIQLRAENAIGVTSGGVITFTTSSHI